MALPLPRRAKTYLWILSAVLLGQAWFSSFEGVWHLEEYAGSLQRQVSLIDTEYLIGQLLAQLQEQQHHDQRETTSPSTALPVVDYLLNVPFYVYPELLWIENTTLTADLVTELSGGKPFLDDALDMANMFPKHSNDVYFARAALRHPMRTLDPAKAKLFVVPTLLNILAGSRYFSGDFCYRNKHHTLFCNGRLLDYAERVLSESPWFQSHEGRDHIVVRSEWFLLRQSMPSFDLCNEIRFEDRKLNDRDRYSFADYYVGRPCPVVSEKVHDFVMVASIKNNWKFKARKRICDWMREQPGNENDTDATTAVTKQPPVWSMPVCGAGQQCPALAQARFGFHVRGDTFGANRLMDTLLSHTVPIFTMPEQYDVLPDWIDWDQLSYLATVGDNKDKKTKEQFLETINAIAVDSVGYNEKMQNVIANRDLFDWTTMVPFDTHMYMLSAKLWPEQTRRKTVKSRYSALILP